MPINKQTQKIRDRARYRWRHDAEYRQKKLIQRRKYYHDRAEQVKAKMRATHVQDPRRRMVYAARKRARRDGVPFDIVYTDFTMPAICPITERPFVIGRGRPVDDSPSLDRLIPALGYVKGNVAVLSHRANKIKNDATPELLMRAAQWLIAQASFPSDSGPALLPG